TAMPHRMKLLLLALLLLLATELAAGAEDARSPDAEADVSDDDDPADDKAGVDAAAPPAKPVFTPPKVPAGAYYAQFFTAPSNLAEQLVLSKSKKEGVDSDLSKYDGFWSVEVPESSAIDADFALVLKSKAKHHAVSAKLAKPFAFDQPGKQFVMQYEVKFQNGMDCGGAYVKLLTDGPGMDLKEFNDKTPYTIMFGPDKCGMDHKLHFILRHKNPKSGKIEEKHAKKPKADLDSYFNDKRTHLYTLVLNSDNSFEVYVDRSLVNSGSLLEDMQPPVNPPKEIDDPNDKKPADWDEREKIPDPKAVKPDDWDETQPEFIEDAEAVMPQGWLVDEPLTVPDPKAEKPKDWDEDMDGSWEPAQVDNPKCKEAPGCGPWTRPKVKNPKYKGKWSAPMIDNPAYKGIWKPRVIPNPDYFEDKEPWRFAPIGAIGFELWSMNDGVVFDNLLIVDRKSLADDFAEQTWTVKREAERLADPGAQSVVDAVRDATKDRPWIWAVLLLVIALPAVLLIVYCCRGSPAPAASQASQAARRKKTDEATPDSGAPAAATESKANLESDEDEEGDENGEQQDGEEAGDDEGEEAAPAKGDSAKAGNESGSARKRAPRKE
ncbi:hypothetical protein BOX15_Mlig031555g1, partial [Macrostomum lignano]